MSNSLVAPIYASALLELADERGKRAAVVQSCRDLNLALTGEVVAMLDDPGLGRSRAQQCLKTLLAGKIEQEVLDVLLLLIDRNRLLDAQGILAQTVRQAETQAGLVQAEVTTAVALAPGALDALAVRVKAILGPGAVLTNAVDARLIGGMTLRIDDLFVDGSVKCQLADIKARILGVPLGNQLWEA